jgi:uncharacterized protein YydD (DUF2326 family)
MLSGCSPKKNLRKKDISCTKVAISCVPNKSNEAYGQAVALLREWETVLLDIPFPLGAMPIDHEHTRVSENQQFLAYAVNQSENNLVKFFEQEMERLGWQKISVLRDFEALLIFTKPDRICSISLRDASQEIRDASQEISSDKEELSSMLVVVTIGKRTQALSFAQEPGNYDEDLS